MIESISTYSSLFEQTLGVLIVTAPVWLPILLGWGLFNLWMTYIRMKNVHETEFVLLEIKLPREIEKSPAAMELVLSAFWQSDPANNFIKRYWIGKIMPWFSLEMVSIGGDIHFFVWGPKDLKNVVESRIYAQYPNVEIYEVPDYTRFADFDPEENDIWASEHKLKKPDPYPLATYVDFGLHENPKEYEKVDPLVSFIEYLGSLEKEEQFWHQIIIRKHQKRRGRKHLFKKTDWKKEGEDLIEKLKKDFSDDEEKEFSMQRLTEGQQKVLKAIERNISKNGYEVGIRSIYLAPKDAFNAGPNISGFWGSFFQVNTPDLNGLEGSNFTDFKYDWQDFNDIRMNRLKRRLMDAYKARGYFYPPYRKKPFILNTEELATIYHFVGSVAQTPTFGRISSKKSEPPTNLPVKDA